MPTLNDIIPPSRRREVGPSETAALPPQQQQPRSPRRQNRFPYATVFGVIIVIAASAGALMYFSSARVEVTPAVLSAAVQNSFTASQDAGALPYEIITAQKIATQNVKGSGTKTVNSSASGTITIYNTQAKAQKLVATTRFATTAGLIFRIHSAVSVPAGTSAKPGSVTATVYADKAGDTYNVAPTAFTLPGFAGTPQSNQVYGRSTVAFTGGASGTVPVTDSATEAQATNSLVNALMPDLAASIKAQVPAGYTLVTGSATTTYQELAAESASSTDSITIREQGTVTAVVFPTAALAKAIALSLSASGYQGEPITLLPASTLTLSAGTIPSVNTDPFSFNLSGTAALEYTVDPTRIAAAVSGKTRAAAEVALTNYPEVKRAIITLRPFWRQSFPQDPSTITVTVNNP